MVSAEAHGGHDIGGASASGDQGRPPLHMPVPDLASGVEA
jgi:hypothetical protein